MRKANSIRGINMKRNFIYDTQGLVLVAIVAIVFIFTTSIIGLVGALAVNKIADAVTPYVGSDIRALNLVTSCRNVYIVSVVVADISLVVWLFISAQRKESQEAPQMYFP